MTQSTLETTINLENKEDLKELASKAYGMILGVALGDALGAPVENKSKWEIQSAYGTLTEITSAYTTDDTGQMLALARSLVEIGEYNEESAGKHYLNWFETDGYGIGSNSKYVFEQFQQGVSPRKAAQEFLKVRPNRQPSNGCLMRSAPIALRYLNNSQLEQISRQDASLTHAHPYASETCVFFNKLLAQTLLGQELDFNQGFKDGNQAQREVYRVANAETSSLAETMAGADRGYILVPLAVAAWAIKTFDDPEEAMVWTVNLGGDADTNAAIVGSLFGAKYGYQNFPDRWASQFEQDELLSLTEGILTDALKTV